MRVVQIVRRFGPVGGMETYAWQLTRALAANGRAVHVVCETNESEAFSNITVEALGGTNPFPRWRHHLRFSQRVAKYWQQHFQPGDIWHSHEFVTCARVGSFHSTVHGAGESRVWHKRLDPTWHLNRWLEKRVMNSIRLEQMVAVSNLVRQQLLGAHPKQSYKLAPHISPGVAPIENPSPIVTAPVLGFIGCEWERKGLRRVLEILRAIPEAKLIIAGVPREEVACLLEGLENRVELFEEKVQIIRGCWSGREFSFNGQHHEIKNLRVMPDPIQQPHPPIWIGASARVSARRAANIGAVSYTHLTLPTNREV